MRRACSVDNDRKRACHRTAAAESIKDLENGRAVLSDAREPKRIEVAAGLQARGPSLDIGNTVELCTAAIAVVEKDTILLSNRGRRNGRIEFNALREIPIISTHSKLLVSGGVLISTSSGEDHSFQHVGSV